MGGASQQAASKNRQPTKSQVSNLGRNDRDTRCTLDAFTKISSAEEKPGFNTQQWEQLDGVGHEGNSVNMETGGTEDRKHTDRSETPINIRSRQILTRGVTLHNSFWYLATQRTQHDKCVFIVHFKALGVVENTSKDLPWQKRGNGLFTCSFF